MPELFEEQAERTPEAVAIECRDQRLTYRELNERSNRLAHHLRANGVGPEVLVGVHAERSAKSVSAVLGILKAGGAYVPLDTDYPAERLRHIMTDARLAALVHDGDLPDGVDVLCRKIHLQHDAETITPASAANPSQRNAPADAAYVIYTSGSTGRPKGVCMTHGALLNLIQWQNSASSVGAGQRTLQFAPLGFDVSFQEIFSTLSTGGTLVIAPREERKDFFALVRLIERVQIQRLFLPCVALEYVAQVVAETGHVPGALREVIVAGEQLRITPAIKALFAQLDGARLVNQYGPTEAHVVSACELTGDPIRWPFWAPIGRPTANTQLYILDPQLEPVPVGVEGELYIGGAQVARGYWRQPELTAERFIPDPFSSELAGRLYRTGDLARHLPDGKIEFLGRSDDQVKIRGFRVELGEVESVLAHHPKVRQCVVTEMQLATGGKCLAAYLVPAEGTQPSAQEFKDFLKEKLPSHMVPGAYTILTALPLSPHGKVDRRALPPPDVESRRGDAYFAPRNDLENQIMQAWQNVFVNHTIGVRDNFFDLGGDSLLALTLIAEINRLLKVDLEVLTLFDNPTVEELARVPLRDKKGASERRITAIHPGGEGPPLVFLWRNAPVQSFARAHVTKWRQPFLTTEAPFSREVLEDAVRDDRTRFPSVEEIAAAHTDLIHQAGLRGPFLLAGYSYGGALAFEVGHQLLGLGHTIEAVLIFDSDRPIRQWQRWQWHARRFVQEGPSYVWRRIHSHLDWRRKQAAESAQTANDSGTEGTGANLRKSEDRWETIDRIWKDASDRYRSRPLACRGVLFKATDSIYPDKHDFDGCLGWRRLFTKGLEVIEIPANHYSMWQQPAVQALFERWNSSLEKMRASPPP
ncbi:MAG: amino acid adenylation domain-containing protein [Chthoniobacteraceae bacterium]